MFEKFVMNLRSNTIYDHIDWTGFSDEQKSRWISDYNKHYMAFTELLASYEAAVLLVKLRHCMASLVVLPDDPVLLDARKRVERLLFSGGMRMINSGEIEKSLSLAKDILKIFPSSPVAWMLRSVAVLKNGDIQNSLTAAERAVKLAPRNPDTHFNKGVILANMGRFAEAAVEYKETFKLTNEAGNKYGCYPLLRVLRILANAYFSSGQFDRTVAAAEKAIEIASASGQQDLVEDAEKQLRAFRILIQNTQ